MSRPKHIQVSIPSPCVEGRQTMHPEGRNQFCGRCQKVIIDFSRMSDAEIGRILAQPNAPTCGRFRRDQLDRPLAYALAAPQWGWPRLAAGALVLMLAMPHALLAQAPTVASSAVVTSLATNPAALPIPSGPSGDDSTFVLKGHVIQAISGVPYQSAQISCSALNLFVSTNDSGYFVMDIPSTRLQDTLDLEVSWEGDYRIVQVSIDRQLSTMDVTLALQMQEMLLDGIMIAEPTRLEPVPAKVGRKRR